jgi:hypothetical protein
MGLPRSTQICAHHPLPARRNGADGLNFNVGTNRFPFLYATERGLERTQWRGLNFSARLKGPSTQLALGGDQIIESVDL